MGQSGSASALVYCAPSRLETPMPSARESHRSILCGVLSDRDDVVFGSFTLERWRCLVGAARKEGVLPLLRHSFSHAGWPESMPRAIRQQLDRGALAGIAANNIYYRELARILAAMG